MDLNGTLSPHININSIVAVWCPVWPSCSYQCYIRYLICALPSPGIHTIYYFIWKQKKLKWKYILLTSNKILIKICSEFWKISSQPFYIIHWIGCTLQLFPSFIGSWKYGPNTFEIYFHWLHIRDHSIVCIRLESLFWAVNDSDQSQLWVRWPGCCGASIGGHTVPGHGYIRDQRWGHMLTREPGGAIVPMMGAMCVVSSIDNRAANDPSVFTITEKAITRALSWLKAHTSAFTFKTLC